jgi:glycosyltransferase involved in cell wall biosynthesis
VKISLITVCFNAEKTIEKTIQSVLSQDYPNIEYIVVDGLSKDGTMDVVNKYKNSIAIVRSEKDKGMYDGINKGINLATGEVVGTLNADDVFASNTIVSEIAHSFLAKPNIDSIIGDISFMNENGKQIRYYSSAKWHPGRFVWGFMPAHPGFYCKKKIFEKLGNYRTDFDIAADYELLIRFFTVNRLEYLYLPLLMVKMNLGGKSTSGFKSTKKINQEIKKACRLNHLYTNYFMLYSKYFWKILEFFPLENLKPPN